METQPLQVEWEDVHGAWLLLRSQLPILLIAAGVDLKLAADLNTGVEALDELFRRINSKATLAMAAGEVEPDEKETVEPEVLATISSRSKVADA